MLAQFVLIDEQFDRVSPDEFIFMFRQFQQLFMRDAIGHRQRPVQARRATVRPRGTYRAESSAATYGRVDFRHRGRRGGGICAESTPARVFP